MKKDVLVNECAEIFVTEKVKKWYAENMEGRPQANTIDSLEKALEAGELTHREALAICFIVGLQWHEKFSGVP